MCAAFLPGCILSWVHKAFKGDDMLLKSNKDCDAEKLTIAFISSVNFKGIYSKLSKHNLLGIHRFLLAAGYSLVGCTKLEDMIKKIIFTLKSFFFLPVMCLLLSPQSQIFELGKWNFVNVLTEGKRHELPYGHLASGLSPLLLIIMQEVSTSWSISI